MFDDDDESAAGGYWPSVTDLFITLFIITIVILAVVFFLSNNRGLGPLFGEIRKPTNELREVLGLPRIRETQSPRQVVAAVQETSEAAITKIAKLEALIRENDDPDLIAKLRAEIDQLKKERDALFKRIAELEKLIGAPSDLNELLRQIEDLKKENEELKRGSRTRVIAEQRKEFQFDPGSAVIKKDFSSALREKIPNENVGYYDPPFPQIAAEVINLQERVNTLEIIGHTDGVPLSRYGNLDQMIPILLTNDLQGLENLSAGSNNDLGLLRSLALKREWINYVESYEPNKDREILRRLKIRCYSAGQTIPPVPIDNPTIDVFRKKDDRARRIEMRLTRHANDTTE
jgi:flagellar motor protein MotB